MTPEQRADAVLLRELGRPAEAISANTGIPVEIVKVWLRSERWPGPQQTTLFDATGLSPRPEVTKPAIAGRNHGLHLISSPTGKSDTTQATRSGVMP